MKFHEIPSSKSRVFPFGQMDSRADGHDEATVTFFFNLAKAPKSLLKLL
jgi:hypothetical protein